MLRTKRLSPEATAALQQTVESIDPADVTAEDFCRYFTHCIGGLAQVSRPLYAELVRRWVDFLGTGTGRGFLRRLALKCTDRDLDDLVCALSEEVQNEMQRVAPDLFYVVNRAFFQSIEFVLLLRIESLAQKMVCRKTASVEFVMPAALEDALHINFYKRAGAVHMQWSAACIQTRFAETWAIPPQARWTPGLWYVSQARFEERLTWLCPFLPALMRTPLLRQLGAVLSGSILPLCLLSHEVYMETRFDFLAYAAEIYKNCSVDLFIAGRDVSPEHLADIVKTVEQLSRTNTWTLSAPCEWAEDDEWVRKRRGTTFYLSSPLSTVVIQIICMPTQSAEAAISHQHLPCVRASYDGTDVFVTAQCMESWMSRFVSNPPLFGSSVSQQRRSRTAFKYAIRGWGFSQKATADMQFPDTLYRWLRDWPEKKPLPWFHPLYNPNMWSKAMSRDRVQQLIDCAEI